MVEILINMISNFHHPLYSRTRSTRRHSRDEVGQWMGTAMSCNNIGIVSPLLGGIIYDKSGKMGVFAIIVAFGAMDIVL